MKISLNGLDLPKTAEGSLTVREVLKGLQHEIHASGKLLLKAVLDGVPLAESWESDYRVNTPVDLVKHLELVIDEPKHAAQQLLKDSCALVERLTNKTGELARKFRIGNEVVANNELVEFLDELKLVLTGLDYSTRQPGLLPEVATFRRRMEVSASQLAPTLDRIYHAQSSGDTVTIADEIQYELPEQINSLKDLLTETTQVMNARP